MSTGGASSRSRARLTSMPNPSVCADSFKSPLPTMMITLPAAPSRSTTWTTVVSNVVVPPLEIAFLPGLFKTYPQSLHISMMDIQSSTDASLNDVYLLVPGKLVTASSAVLAARSPVFERILTRQGSGCGDVLADVSALFINMHIPEPTDFVSEIANKKVITFPGLSEAILLALLHFLHSGAFFIWSFILFY